MKLFSIHGSRRGKGVFECGRTALKCRAKKLLQRVIAGCKYLFERTQQRTVAHGVSVFTRKFREPTTEAVNGRVATTDYTRKSCCASETKRLFVGFNRTFGVVFGNFLKSGFCSKNRKNTHKSRLKASVRLMCFFSRKAIGIFRFPKKHETDTGNFRRRIQPKGKARGYEYGHSEHLSLLLRHPVMNFRPHFGCSFASGTRSRRGFASFRQNPQYLCEAQSASNGRTYALLREKTALFLVVPLFIGFLRFGTPVASASENNPQKPPQTVTKANKGGSSNKTPAKAPTKGATPLPDVASPNAPAPNAEPKEIKALKSYCKHHPNDWEGFYNLGIEQYKLMDYAAAQQSFAQALQNCSDPKEQEKIFYNLGNAGFRFSQSQSVDQQVLGFKESLQNYENALAIDKEAKDTQHNIEVVKRYLKRAEKQQQQEQQNKKDDKKDDNKKLTNMEKDNDSSDNKDQDKDKDKDKDKDDKDDPKNDQQNNQGDKDVDLEQKEMDNILNRAKKVEKMLPPSSLNPQSGGKDPVIRDW